MSENKTKKKGVNTTTKESDDSDKKIDQDGSSINYDDIDNIIDLIYKATYDRNESKIKLRYEYIPKHQLETWQYKKSSQFDWSDILKNIKYVGTSKDKIIFSREANSSKKYSCIIKFVFYSKDNPDINDSKRKENVDLQIAYLLGELVSTKQTPFILYNLMNFDVKMSELNDGKNYKSIFEKLNESDKKTNNVSVQVSEQYYKMSSLSQHLKQPMEEYSWKILLFQICHVLGKIQEKFPLFRHNNFIVKSFVCYIHKTFPKQTSHEYNGIIFNLPSNEFEVRLTNYERSVIPNLVDNKDITVEETKTNPNYDLTTIMNDLLKYNPPKKIHDEINNIIKEGSNVREVLMDSSLFDSFRESGKKLSEVGRTHNSSYNSNKNKRNKKIYGYDKISYYNKTNNMASDRDDSSLFMDADDMKKPTSKMDRLTSSKKNPVITKIKKNRRMSSSLSMSDDMKTPKKKKKSGGKSKMSREHSKSKHKKKDDSDSSDSSSDSSNATDSSTDSSDSSSPVERKDKITKLDKSDSSDSDSDDGLSRMIKKNSHKSSGNKYKDKYKSLLKKIKKGGNMHKNRDVELNSIGRVLGGQIQDTKNLPLMPGSNFSQQHQNLDNLPPPQMMQQPMMPPQMMPPQMMNQNPMMYPTSFPMMGGRKGRFFFR